MDISEDKLNALSLQRTLVTGAGGFVGLHLCKLLSRYGAEVHAVVRREAPHLVAPHRIHQLDLCDIGAVRKLIADVRPEYIFHLAGVTSAARSLDVVLPTFQSNVVSTVNLLTAMTEQPGCRRIVLAGSLEEPLEPGHQTASSPYAASKMAGTMYAKMFHSLYGTPATVARIFMVYGPAQPDTRKLVPYVALSLLKNMPPKLSSGTRPVDWVYVEDVADALAHAAIAPGLEGKTIDVGSGVLTPVKAVAQKIAELVNNGLVPVFGTIPDRSDEQVHAANVQSTRDLLGRTLETPLAEGLLRTVDWYRQQLESAAVEAAT